MTAKPFSKHHSLHGIWQLSPPGAILGEGPLWSQRDRCVSWVDILGQSLHAYYLETERRSQWAFDEPTGWVIEREAGGFICGLMSGFAALSLDPFQVTPIINPYPNEPENRLNDAKADRFGRIFAGSMHSPITKTSGALYRLNADLSVTVIDQPYTIANGPAFDVSGRQMYHTDSALHQIYIFDVDGRGEVGHKRLFLEFPPSLGSPDGMTVDADDGLWVAHWAPQSGLGRISRFRPDASLDFFIELPTPQITSLCFAGDHLDRVFVTSAAQGLSDDPLAGALFEIDPDLLRGHRGMEPHRFKDQNV